MGRLQVAFQPLLQVFLKGPLEPRRWPLPGGEAGHRTRGDDDGVLPDADESESTARQTFLGALLGLVLLAWLAVGFGLLAHTPLPDWIRDRDREKVLTKLQHYEEAHAFEHAIGSIQGRLAQPISGRFQTELALRRVELLLQRAAQLEGASRLQKVETARSEADALGRTDLARRAALEIESHRIEQRLLEQRDEIDRNEALLRKLRESGLEARRDHQAVTVNLPDILFETGQSTLTPDLQALIPRIASILFEEAPHQSIRVEGHTDSTGTRQFNQGLSDARAKTVALALIAAGIPAARIQTVGLADTRPLASNETPEGRARNRRVEIMILHP